MLIVDELLLLVTDDTTGKRRGGPASSLDAALGTALLVELSLRERISIAPAESGWRERGKVTVIDPSPTDDPDLDALLARLAGQPGQRVRTLINPAVGKRISSGLRNRRLALLVRQGVLAEERSDVLGIRRHPTRDAAPEHEVRARLQAALVDGLTPTERTVALIALLDAAQLLMKVATWADKRAVKARAKELSKGDWAAKAVRDAIAQMTAAMAASATAAAAAGSGG